MIRELFTQDRYKNGEVDGNELAYGKGKSKKQAEMEAARIALENL